MLKSINQTDAVYVVQQPQNDGRVQQNHQLPYAGNVCFERNPVADDFQRQNTSGTGATTKALGILGTLALLIVGFSRHRGAKILKGKNSSLLEKIKVGSKDLINDAKKLFSKKAKNVSGDLEELVEGAEKKSQGAFTERVGGQKSASKGKVFEAPEIRNKQPKLEYQSTGTQDTQRQNIIDKIRELYAERPTGRQQLEINKNNRKAQEAFAKSRQIGENIPKDVAEKLKNMHSTQPKKAVPNVKQPVVISKPINETKVKKPVRLKSKRSGVTAAPKKAVQKPLMRSNTQMKIIEQINPKAASEIKGLEGNIKRIEKQIEGAKKFGNNKNTTVLEKNLETNKKKLAKLKAETFGSIETVNPVKKQKGRTANITSPRSERLAERKDVPKAVSEKKQANANQEPVRAKVEAAQKGTTTVKPVETIQELANTPFNKISGVKESVGLVKQYDAKGNLLRSVRDRGNGIVEVTEYKGHNTNGISYYMRDGMIIKKSDIGKQSENMRRLVHNLEGVNDKDEIKRIVGSYADRYGMKEVNDTIMIGGKQVKVIYRGFDCDITADGRVISRKYAADGTCTFHVDITEQLSKKTPDKTNMPWKHKKHKQNV